MSESRLEIDNQEYQTYLSELGKGWVGLGWGPWVPGSGGFPGSEGLGLDLYLAGCIS
jgi:hypothetical protein